MRKESPLLQKIGVAVCVLLLMFNYSEPMLTLRALPDVAYSDDAVFERLAALPMPFSVKIEGDESREVSSDLSERLGTDDDSRSSGTVEVDLLGIIPLKHISFYEKENILVMPGGESVGITVHSDGALVVGLGSVGTEGGEMICPAAEAGIRAGDVIKTANGQKVNDAAHLGELCAGADGIIEVTVSRGGDTLFFSIQPVTDKSDGRQKLGMWVRDSTAGIGTISFYMMDSLRFAALGHAITDVDTGVIMSIKKGEVISSSIIGVSQGAEGTPGEIRGTFSNISERLGTLESNTEYGIYGQLYSDMINPLYPEGLPLAYPEEAELGHAQILTSVDSDGMKAYDCEIIKLYQQYEASGKGMVIRITDSELLKKTGGIIQGMSGSPVIQNERLLGAVTHVFVNDPTKGYCIYALWMSELCR